MAKDYNPSQRNREAFEALTDTAGNVPPQAVELEEAVLGALMLEKDRDRKSTRLNSSHMSESRMPSSA